MNVLRSLAPLARFGLVLSCLTGPGACSAGQEAGHLQDIDAGDDGDASMNGDAGSDAAPEPVPTMGADYLAFAPQQLTEASVLELSFQLPPEARSFVLTAEVAARGHVLLMNLWHADGTMLFDRAQAEAGPFRPALSQNLELDFPLSVLYPSAPSDLPLTAGRYRVRVGFVPEAASSTPPQIALDVVWQTRLAPTSLPVNVWLARGAREDAESLIADNLYLAAFAELRDIFASLGVGLEPLQAYDLGAEGTELSEIGSEEALNTLLTELEKTPASGLDIVLVDRIVATGKTVRGKTTGIPGPPAHPQLRRRGAVVLAMEALPRDATRIAEAFAHEAAHYLGLRHTTELDGMQHDPIGDTPECPIELASYQTTAGETLLSSADCQRYDGPNLLFPMPPFDSKPQHALSPDQITVLRGSPLLR